MEVGKSFNLLWAKEQLDEQNLYWTRLTREKQIINALNFARFNINHLSPKTYITVDYDLKAVDLALWNKLATRGYNIEKVSVAGKINTRIWWTTPVPDDPGDNPDRVSPVGFDEIISAEDLITIQEDVVAEQAITAAARERRAVVAALNSTKNSTATSVKVTLIAPLSSTLASELFALGYDISETVTPSGLYDVTISWERTLA